MTRRIFRSIFIASLSALLVAFILTTAVLYTQLTLVQRDQLREQAVLAAEGVKENRLDYLTSLRLQKCRLTWIAADGTVLYDSETAASGMENHLQREEVQEALKNGSGESERYSNTLLEKTLYYAMRLEDGTVLRVSVSQHSIWKMLTDILLPLLAVLLAAVALSAWLASRLSARLAAPINQLDLDHPLKNETYEELSPLLVRIEHQRQRIQDQVDELYQKQKEFSAVTGGMKEGLILLDKLGRILSINSAASDLFSAEGNCIGKDFLAVSQNLEIQDLILSAQNGHHAEKVIALNGGNYQIDVSPILSDQQTEGIVIFAFDVTEREEAEQQRREFSANVTHELKTPLQTIIGSAELMEEGLVKPEDLKSFAGRIRKESQRLLALINDILRLSQLDEGKEFPAERVNLRLLAQEVKSSLAPAAAAADVTFIVRGEAVMTGVRRMLYEIIYNLCDNAIRYNNKGGWVDVFLSQEDNGTRLIVSDTGIGIPKADQPHVFERFYRVDKSHSRETGGTGLGLSIVKHAALLHHADISLESNPGKGTRISIFFPASVQ